MPRSNSHPHAPSDTRAPDSSQAAPIRTTANRNTAWACDEPMNELATRNVAMIGTDRPVTTAALGLDLYQEVTPFVIESYVPPEDGTAAVVHSYELCPANSARIAYSTRSTAPEELLRYVTGIQRLPQRDEEHAAAVAALKEMHATRLTELARKMRTLQQNEFRLQMDVAEWKYRYAQLREGR